MYGVGLMSGTSLDGVDAALLRIEGAGRKTRLHLIAFRTLPFSEPLKEEIRLALRPETGRVDRLCSLNFKLGEVMADAVEAVCREAGFPLSRLDFIASHGQTLWHTPRPGPGEVRSTLQLGEPAVIAYRTGVQVVSGFRTMDVAAGGEGAPLVPYSEWVLYGSESEHVALQNIGGIGNVTILPAGGSPDAVYAFDTGPGNMIIDEVMHRLYNLPYDEEGGHAAAGHVNQPMLHELEQHPYIRQPLPKSTGRELFGAAYTASLIERWDKLPPDDLVATVTAFTAYTIAESYRLWVLPRTPIRRTVVGGGGAHNPTLLAMLRRQLPEVEVVTQEALGYSSDAKEAIAFAILGNETLHGRPSNVPSATGATEPVILGSITPAPRPKAGCAPAPSQPE